MVRFEYLVTCNSSFDRAGEWASDPFDSLFSFPHSLKRSFDSPQEIGSIWVENGYIYHVSKFISIWELDKEIGCCYSYLYKPNWFASFQPDDHAPAVQRLSELGLNEYAMDLIRQAKDAGFIAPELAPVLRL